MYVLSKICICYSPWLIVSPWLTHTDNWSFAFHSPVVLCFHATPTRSFSYQRYNNLYRCNNWLSRNDLLKTKVNLQLSTAPTLEEYLAELGRYPSGPALGPTCCTFNTSPFLSEPGISPELNKPRAQLSLSSDSSKSLPGLILDPVPLLPIRCITPAVLL